RRRRARRGGGLGGDRRSGRPAPRRGHVDRRPQPPVAGPRRPRHRRRAHRRDVRRGGLADRHRQVRPAAARPVRARRRRGAAGAHRHDAQRGVPVAPARDRRCDPRAAAQWREEHRARVARLKRRRGLARAARPRRPRPRRPARRAAAGRRRQRPADRAVRVHDQGVVAADPGPSRQPLGAAVTGSVGGAGRRSGRRPRRPLGAVCRRHAGGAAVRGRGGAARARAVAPARAASGARRRRAHAQGRRVDPAGVRALLRRPRARGARGVRARRHGQPRRGVLDEPRRLDQPRGDLEPRRARRLVRRRHRDADPLARVRARPAHRAGDRGGQPGRRAG
ncbi:MAG: hypothetical protein QOI64_2590, partial [Solirubrobacteraceae bacterium]|nr:hypothetical protein [Solirubrobacteraceae bacterium]